MASHTRNVAGYRLTKISRAVYEQRLPNGLMRWFVRYRIGKSTKYCWKYTEPFREGKTPERESMKFKTLTDAVIAAN